jgi:hypothetical protein
MICIKKLNSASNRQNDLKLPFCKAKNEKRRKTKRRVAAPLSAAFREYQEERALFRPLARCALSFHNATQME